MPQRTRTREEIAELRRALAAEKPRNDALTNEAAAEAATIGAALRRLREQAGIGLAELAARSGIDKGYLSRLENGHRSPSLDTITRYAHALGRRAELSFPERV